MLRNEFLKEVTLLTKSLERAHPNNFKRKKRVNLEDIKYPTPIDFVRYASVLLANASETFDRDPDQALMQLGEVRMVLKMCSERPLEPHNRPFAESVGITGRAFFYQAQQE